jgi:hypothetical protein
LVRAEHILRVFENEVMVRILGAKRDKVPGNGEKYIKALHCVNGRAAS